MDFLTEPFTTALLFLYQYVGQNIVLTIVIFTILIRLVTYPLNNAQMKSSRAMQELQPKIKKLQDKYKGDREKLAQEQMKLYKEHGVNPTAGCLPLLIQFPILFSLYPAIGHLLASTPLQMVGLYHSLMTPSLSYVIPLQNQFLWLNMAQPDPYYVLPILVVATTWLQQKLMTPTTTPSNDPSATMSRNMMITMPLLFGLMALQFAAGLSIYFIVSNLAGIGQYALYNRTGASSAVPARAEPEEVEEPVETPKKKGQPVPVANRTSGKMAARRSAAEAHRKKKSGGAARTPATGSTATGSLATGRTKAGKAR